MTTQSLLKEYASHKILQARNEFGLHEGQYEEKKLNEIEEKCLKIGCDIETEPQKTDEPMKQLKGNILKLTNDKAERQRLYGYANKVCHIARSYTYLAGDYDPPQIRPIIVE